MYDATYRKQGTNGLVKEHRKRLGGEIEPLCVSVGIQYHMLATLRHGRDSAGIKFEMVSGRWVGRADDDGIVIGQD